MVLYQRIKKRGGGEIMRELFYDEYAIMSVLYRQMRAFLKSEGYYLIDFLKYLNENHKQTCDFVNEFHKINRNNKEYEVKEFRPEYIRFNIEEDTETGDSIFDNKHGQSFIYGEPEGPYDEEEHKKGLSIEMENLCSLLNDLDKQSKLYYRQREFLKSIIWENTSSEFTHYIEWCMEEMK